MKPFFIKLLRAFKLMFGRYKKVNFNDLTHVGPVNPSFGAYCGTSVDRYYIEKFLSENKQHIHGRILEIADNRYSRMYADMSAAEKPILETLHYDGTDGPATIIGDLTNIGSLPGNRYDCFVCTQTYNFIFDVQKAIEGTYFLLKEGGTVLATVAGISQISRYDMDRWGDYWRFTDQSIKRLFENAGFSKVEVRIMGNCLAASAFLQGIVIDDFPQKSLLDETDIDYQVTLGVTAIK